MPLTVSGCMDKIERINFGWPVVELEIAPAAAKLILVW